MRRPIRAVFQRLATPKTCSYRIDDVGLSNTLQDVLEECKFAARVPVAAIGAGGNRMYGTCKPRIEKYRVNTLLYTDSQANKDAILFSGSLKIEFRVSVDT